MTISLQSFAETGETAYISKHNANVAALIAFLNSLESTVASVSGGGTGSAANIGKATYGTTGMSLIGSGSFTYTTPTTLILRLSDGFCWDASLGVMHYQSGDTDLNFGGYPADTYYITFDGASTPQILTSSTRAIYEVDWGGASINSVTLLASVTPTATDYADISDSDYSGIDYDTPLERLQATEKAFSTFFAANMGLGDYTPTVAQIMEAIGVKLTGDLTTNNTLFVPAKAKVHLVRNECTTANASNVTIKTAVGTGVTLLPGEHAVLYCDGTNVLQLYRQGAANTITSIGDLDDVPDSLSGMGLRLLRVREDELGVEFVTASSVVAAALDVQKDTAGVGTDVAILNFEGAGVTVEESTPGTVKVTIPGGGGAALEAQDEGVQVDAGVTMMNFAGDGVSVAQTAAGEVLVTIPGGAGGGSVDYDISFFVGGKRPAGETVFRHTFTKAVDYPADFSTSDGDALTAATDEAIFLLKKNGTQIGTVTFAAAGTTATFASSGTPFSFVAGDTLAIVAPSPQDSTLAGVSLTLAGTRA